MEVIFLKILVVAVVVVKMVEGLTVDVHNLKQVMNHSYF